METLINHALEYQRIELHASTSSLPVPTAATAGGRIALVSEGGFAPYRGKIRLTPDVVGVQVDSPVILTFSAQGELWVQQIPLLNVDGTSLITFNAQPTPREFLVFGVAGERMALHSPSITGGNVRVEWIPLEVR